MEGVLLTANRLVGTFTSERWCDLLLRLLATPSDIIGVIASRNAKKHVLGAVQAFRPGWQAGASVGYDNDDDPSGTGRAPTPTTGLIRCTGGSYWTSRTACSRRCCDERD